MVQQVIVIALVAACGFWLAREGVKFLRPKAGGKGCGAGCCDGTAEKPAASKGSSAGQVVMIRSDDLRARVAARKSAGA